MTGCAQALPRCTAEAVVKAVVCWTDGTSGGVGYDEDEAVARETMRAWMKIWRANPLRPGPVYQEWLMQRRWSRAGAETKLHPNQIEIQSMVRPTTLSRTVEVRGVGNREDTRPVPGGKEYRADFVTAKLELIMAKLSKGTRAGYRGAWRQWVWFLSLIHISEPTRLV